MFNFNPTDADKQGGGIYLWIRIEHIDMYYNDLGRSSSLSPISIAYRQI